jgi:replicative DNA helicase
VRNEIEIAVLGAMLVSEKAHATGKAQLSQAHFRAPGNSQIFEIIAQTKSEDMITMIMNLEPQQRARCLELMDNAELIGSFEAKVSTLKKALKADKLKAIAEQIVEDPYREAAQLMKALTDLSIADDNPIAEGNINSTLVELIGEVQKPMAEKKSAFIPTRFTAIDTLLKGLRLGGFTILAGRPGSGKTTLALNIALNIARHGTPTAIISLEMTKKELAYKLLSLATQISLDRLTTDTLFGFELKKVVEQCSELSKIPLHISDSPLSMIDSIEDFSNKSRQKHGLKLLVLDYIQLVKAPGNRDQVQELTEITRRLKTLALKHEVAILGLAQVNRVIEARTSKVPLLSDLKGSGSLEQDADAIVFIAQDGELTIAKNRHGKCGAGRLYFHGDTSCYSEVEKT